MKLLNRLTPDLLREALLIAVSLNAGGLATLLFLVGPGRLSFASFWLGSTGLMAGLCGFALLHRWKKQDNQADRRGRRWKAPGRRSQTYLAVSYCCVAASLSLFAIGCVVLFTEWAGIN